jgi:cytochrome P450
VIYFLAQHPAEMQRARAEVDRILGPRASQDEHVMISADKIHELECCKAIFNETLRLRSVVLGIDRYPVRDTVIDGVTVPGGQGSAIGMILFPF